MGQFSPEEEREAFLANLDAHLEKSSSGKEDGQKGRSPAFADPDATGEIPVSEMAALSSAEKSDKKESPKEGRVLTPRSMDAEPIFVPVPWLRDGIKNELEPAISQAIVELESGLEGSPDQVWSVIDQAVVKADPDYLGIQERETVYAAIYDLVERLQSKAEARAYTEASKKFGMNGTANPEWAAFMAERTEAIDRVWALPLGELFKRLRCGKEFGGGLGMED